MDESRFLVDRCGLYGGNLMPPEALSDQLKPICQRRVAEAAIAFAREGERMIAVNDLSGFTSSICALASAPAIAPMVSLERCMTGIRLMEIETYGTGF